MKTILISLINCILGIFIGICIVVNKLDIKEFSSYEWIAQWITDIIDKPLIQNHGICIIIICVLSFITYNSIKQNASLNAENIQNILQTQEKIFDKMLNKFSKIINNTRKEIKS